MRGAYDHGALKRSFVSQVFLTPVPTARKEEEEEGAEEEDDDDAEEKQEEEEIKLADPSCTAATSTSGHRLPRPPAVGHSPRDRPRARRPPPATRHPAPPPASGHADKSTIAAAASLALCCLVAGARRDYVSDVRRAVGVVGESVFKRLWAVGERETCVCKHGASLASRMISGVYRRLGIG